MITVDGKAIVFPVKSKLQGEQFEKDIKKDFFKKINEFN